MPLMPREKSDCFTDLSHTDDTRCVKNDNEALMGRYQVYQANRCEGETFCTGNVLDRSKILLGNRSLDITTPSSTSFASKTQYFTDP